MIHIYVNQNLTCEPGPRREDIKIIRKQMEAVNEESKEKRQTSPLTEDPEGQRHLGKTLSNCLHLKVKIQGRQ